MTSPGEGAGDSSAEAAGQADAEGAQAAGKEKRGWWFWVSWALILAVLVLGILFLTGAFGYDLAVIDGISMEPTYSRGDVAVVDQGVAPEALRVGDVILYRRGEVTVVHRIVRIEPSGGRWVIVTQGDNVGHPDPPISDQVVVGRVVFTIPWVGYPNLWLQGR